MAEMEKRKKRNRVKIELLKSNAAKMTMAYNPMVAVYGEHFSRWASLHTIKSRLTFSSTSTGSQLKIIWHHFCFTSTNSWNLFLLVSHCKQYCCLRENFGQRMRAGISVFAGYSKVMLKLETPIMCTRAHT